MHHFEYRNDTLFCEAVSVAAIAETVGTPFYLYSQATLERHFTQFDRAFDGIDHLVCYSAKANTNQAILTLFNRMGSGLDIVSGGELYRGLRAGFAPEKIVYSGVGKRIDEIDAALARGILMFNIESQQELELINARAGQLNTTAPVAIRVNPDVDPKTHPYISTGLKQNKFGIDIRTARDAYRAAQALDHVDVVGIDCHIGSQITDTQPFADALQSLKALVTALKDDGIVIKYIDMGGGLGITYQDEAPPALNTYAATISATLKKMPVKLILEPGRVIVGNAGVLVTRVLFIKPGPVKNFVIVDAGMNDLMRPTLYHAYHHVQPIIRKTAGKDEAFVADVVGPICESGDFLAQDRKMPPFEPGDLMALMSAGAYGFTMASNYCSRLKPAEVMVHGERFEVVSRRQDYETLVQNERVPAWMDA